MYKVSNPELRILVIGDLMIDHYIYGTCDRISPEAPIPVVEIKSEMHTLGGAGNVLKNLKALGCNSTIISVTGNDDNAVMVAHILREDNISIDGLIKDDARCTTIKSRVLAVRHQLIRLDREVLTPVDKAIEDAIIEKFASVVNDFDIVLISDYNKGLLTDTLLASIIDLCKKAGKETLVDPKGLDFSKYRNASLIKPNRKEAGLATGIAIKDEETLKQACIKLKEITQCENIVVTLSEDGTALYNDKQLTIIPTKAIDVIDVTGAGDTVLASLGVALASGKSLYDACVFANQAAAIVVSKVGSATATLDEINAKFYN
jgi:rfaE bifunctional protein kinase chain/domain